MTNPSYAATATNSTFTLCAGTSVIAARKC